MKTTETHYRVVTPDFFSDIDSSAGGFLLKTKADAQKELDNFGTQDKKSEYFKNWEKRRRECTIVKVTTTIETI